MKKRISIIFLMAFAQLILTVCTDRTGTPDTDRNSTIVYPSKSANGIEASITFCEKISKKTGKPLKPGITFSIKENGKVTAIVELYNRNFHKDKELMFHLVWLDSAGNSLFKKRIDLDKNDSAAVLTGSLTISPGKRQAGSYSLQVYLFRELIAEKKFKLTRPIDESSAIKLNESIENLTVEITFCRRLNKETGKLVSEGNKFSIEKKSKVLAIINLEGSIPADQSKIFLAEWIDPENKSFLKKKIGISPGSTFFTSSVLTSPDKRKPGIYSLRIFFSGKLIAEKKFELVEEEREKKTTVKKPEDADVYAEITLCKKTDKETGKPVGIDSVFTIKSKSNLTALIRIEKKDTISSRMKFFVEWIGPDDISFFRKKIELFTKNSSSVIFSSISISGKKRKPGNYFVKVYLNKKLLAEKKFILKNEIP